MKKKSLLFILAPICFSGFAKSHPPVAHTAKPGETKTTLQPNNPGSTAITPGSEWFADVALSAPAEVVSGETLTITATGESSSGYVFGTPQLFADPPTTTEPANVFASIDNLQTVGSPYSVSNQASKYSTKITTTAPIPVKVKFNVRYVVGNRNNASTFTANIVITVTVKPKPTTPPVDPPTNPPTSGYMVFFEGNNASQDNLGSYTDRPNQEYNLKKTGSPITPHNDEVRSVKFYNVRVGTVLRVYDDPNGKDNDDWAQVVVKKQVAE